MRLAANSPWIITGEPGSSLTLDGIFVSGADIILRGVFTDVTLSCCTLDPGSAVPGGTFAEASTSPPTALLALSADGRELVPVRLWVEATVTTMTADRCVLGPIHTRGEGNIETLSVSNSIVQGIRTSGLGPIQPDEVKDPARFERLLQLGFDPVSALLRKLSPSIGTLLGNEGSPPLSESPPSGSALMLLLELINELVAGPSIYDAQAFAQVPLSAETRRLLNSINPYTPALALNRSLLEDAYPLELADTALSLSNGSVNLSRCTILGRSVVHRLEASECILQDLASVDDTQNGCVRFSAWADGSVLPRQYESVRIRQAAPLFTATDFGQPGYAQLLPLVDGQILPPSVPTNAPQNTISAGAQDGSEMGAYAREKNPIKQRVLLLKFQEYMPAGLIPVVVNVT
jgi:hypothetical protein